jgi:hypothetical protein
VLVGVSLVAVSARDFLPLLIGAALVAVACLGLIGRYVLARWR